MASSNPPKVSALQKIVQNHLECGICYEQYNDPRVLDCLHSFCKTCLQKYQSTNYKDATMLICPVCRKKTQLHQKDVQALKTNFNITGLADQLEQVCDISLGNLIMKEPKWELGFERFEGLNGAVGVDASLPGDEIAMTDQRNSRVVIYDTTGHQKKTIKLPQCPWDVAAFKNQLVIVDETNSVKMYNRNGNKMFEFHTVPHSEVGKTSVDLQSVAVIKDTIMVGDVRRSVITKHRSSDGSLISTVSVQTRPWYLAIDSKNRVVVSGGSRHRVDIFRVDGATLFSINPKIDSQPVQSCRGVCCDSSAIYIAVNIGYHYIAHIHQYDTQGRFLSCIVQDLNNPCGISLTSDGQQFAVADGDSVKIYNKV
ncbi:uncharacterized protein [Asterias amurensis]|uniref:uncharacterized protein n=1 Tax=Asterias amurensis TaxID=7602 RepID=UPI003AB5B708